MAFPESLDTTAPSGSTSPGLGDNEIVALKQWLLDIFGNAASSGWSISAAPTIIGTDGQWPRHCRLTNKTGGALVAGDVVGVSNANTRSVRLADTANTLWPVVVAAESIADNAVGLFVQSGVVTVKTTGTITIGDYMVKSATTLLATTSGVSIGNTKIPPPGVFGIAMANASGTSSASVYLFGGPSWVPASVVHVTSDGEATTTSASFATLITLTTTIGVNEAAYITFNWRASGAATALFNATVNGGSSLLSGGVGMVTSGAESGVGVLYIGQRTANYLKTGYMSISGDAVLDSDGFGVAMANATITSIVIQGLTTAGTIGVADVIAYKWAGGTGASA